MKKGKNEKVKPILFAFTFCLILSTAFQAFGSPAGFSTFVIPADEENLITVLKDLSFIDDDTMRSVIAITAWADDTEVFIDHWEDGYEYNPESPATSTYDETFSLENKGDAERLESAIETGGGVPSECYWDGTGDRTCPCDGKDIIYVVGGSATVTRAGWIENRTTFQAVAWEVYPVRPQLIKYILPFGEELNSDGLLDFRRVYAFIQATSDDTIVQIDINGDGTFDSLDWDRNGMVEGNSTTLQKGEVFLLDRVSLGDQAIDYPTGIPDATSNGNTDDNLVITGTTILASDTVQVQYLVGDETATWEVRGLSAFPRGFWDDEYYAPVDESTVGGYITDLLLYNPHSSSITIDWEMPGDSDSFTIPAKQTVSFVGSSSTSLPQGGAVYLKGSDVFWGISTIDSEGQIMDWGYSLVPATLLEKEHYMGWAPAYDATRAEATQALTDQRPFTNSTLDDRSGLFITAARDNTIVYIDEDNDGTPDQTINLDRLESSYVVSSDSPSALNDDDLSQARVYATGPIAMAYGQNPDYSQSGDEPAMDLGYTVLPTTDKWFELVLDVVKTADPAVVAAGTDDEQTTFTIAVSTYEYSVDDVTVTDTLPSNWEYVAGSTRITLPDGTEVTGSTADDGNSTGDTTIVWSGSDVFGSYEDMDENQSIVIEFVAQTVGTGFTEGQTSINEVVAVGTRTVQTVTQTFTASDFAFVGFADSVIEMEKTTGATDPVYPRDTIGYTVELRHQEGSGEHNNVTIYDPIPDGTTYVASSSEVSLKQWEDVEDDFSGNYATDSTSIGGTQDWTDASWTESDPYAGGSSSGSVYISGTGASAQLSFGYDSGAGTVRDNFGSVAYDNNDGSANWAGDWTETDTIGEGASGGTAQVLAGGQFQFAYFNASADIEDDFSDDYSTDSNDAGGTQDWDDASWTETDSYGLNNNSGPGGGYVSVNGSERLEFSGQATYVRDDFSTDDDYTQNDGTEPFADDWEENDGGGAGGGDIQVDNGILVFNDGIDGGEWVQRTVSMNGATNVTITLNWNRQGDLGGEGVRLQTSPDESDWTTHRTFDTDTVGDWTFTRSWEANDPTMYIRFTAIGNWDNNDEAYFYWVQVEYDPPPTPSVVRSADLSGWTDATLTFDYWGDTDLDADDTVEVRASSDGSNFTTVGTYTNVTSTTQNSSGNIDISGYRSGNTTILFRVNGGFETATKTFQIDNVRIYYTRTASANGSAIARQSASLAGATSATLSFSYTGDADNESTDTVVVQASSDGESFTTLGSAYDGTTSGTSGNIDISSYATANTAIRFLVNSGLDAAGETFSIDDVLISYTKAGGAGSSIYRQTADLSNATSASVSFDYTGDADLESGDTVVLEASSDGTDYTVVGTYDGITSTTSTGSGDIDIGSYKSANTHLRFRASSGFDAAGETFSIDNVRVYYETEVKSGFATGGNPPEFLRSGDDYDLYPRQVLTLTFNVTVDAPVKTGLEEIYNVASAISDELAVPLTDDATNKVNNPSSDTGEVGDLVWLDTDGDGVKDVGESGLSNIEVTLKDEYGTPLGVAYTDGTGRYLFTGIQPGSDYYVEVTDGLPAGLVQTAPSGGSNNRTGFFDLAASQTYLDADLGFKPPAGTATIGDLVWNDSDDDGIRDAGELGISGVTVRLYTDTNGDGKINEPGVDVIDGLLDLDGNGVINSSDGDDEDFHIFNVIAGYLDMDGDGSITVDDDGQVGGYYVINGAIDIDGDGGIDGDDDETTNGVQPYTETVTGGDGTYLFAGVTASGTEDYLVSVDISQAALTDYELTTSSIYSVKNMDDEDASMTNDFGFKNTSVTTYTFKDRVWFDASEDEEDDGESGISGVTVNLLDSGRNVLTTVTTDANGYFSFSGLEGGTFYYVEITDSAGKLTDYYGTTAEAAAGELQVSNLTANVDNTVEPTEPSFGYSANGAIGNTVFNDVNGDGDQDAGELGISGVTVKLYNDDDGDGIIDAGVDIVQATLVTDANGNYVFSGLGGTQYIVSVESPPANFSYTGVSPRTDSDSSTTGQQLSVAIAQGGNDMTVDFPYQAAANRSVSGTLWNDTDGEGDFDETEYMENVTVELRDSSDNLISTVTTGSIAGHSAGYYEFAGLPSGSYKIVVTDDYGVLDGFDTTYEISEGALAGSYNSEQDVDLNSGNVANVNFGYNYPTPTYLLLLSFDGFEVDGRMVVQWETAAEIGTIGFDLLRQENDGSYVRVNKKPVPAVFLELGATYQFVDKTADPGVVQQYKLVERLDSGGRNCHGPFTVRTDARQAVEDDRLLPGLIDKGYASRIIGLETAAANVSDKANDEPRSSEPADEKEIKAPATSLTQNASIKIQISEKGLYKIDAADIGDALNVTEACIVERIAKNRIRMSCQGEAVTYLPAEDAASIYFYGQAHSSVYTEQNAYWMLVLAGMEKGDVNLDGFVDSSDLSLCLEVLSGRAPEIDPDYDFSGIDVNGNGKVEHDEAIFVFREMLLSGVSGASPLMEEIAGEAPASTAPDLFFQDEIHFEEEYYYKTNNDIETEDFFFWDMLIGGNMVAGPYAGFDVFEIETHDVASGQVAQLTVNLQGLSNHNHSATITLNPGTARELFLGDMNWFGTDAFSKTFSFAQNHLSEGGNSIEVQCPESEDVVEAFGVESFDLVYYRTYTAKEGSLHFDSDLHEVVTVSGFDNPSAEIELFDLFDPYRPRRLLHVAKNADSLTFAPEVVLNPYLAVDLNAAKAPDAIEAYIPSDWKSEANEAQYLVIAADELFDQAQELANYRMNQAPHPMSSVQVAKLSDVFDEFSHGIFDPYAVRDFIAHAVNKWATPPEFVVLAGHGTLDPKERTRWLTDLLGTSLDNLFPVLVTRTPYGFYESDNQFADIDGDGNPDVALGRIPAKTGDDMAVFLDKVKAYESQLPPVPGPVLMTADKPDGPDENNFPQDSRFVAAGTAPEEQVTEVFYHDPPDPKKDTWAMHTEFVVAINAGQFLVNYIGHGTHDLLSDFFSTRSTDNHQTLLTNSQFPIFSANTCLVGRFAFPAGDCLSEVLTMQASSGFVAAWSPSGLSINTEAVEMNRELFEQIYTENAPNFGTAMKQVLETYNSRQPLQYPFMGQILNLLGDPALALP